MNRKTVTLAHATLVGLALLASASVGAQPAPAPPPNDDLAGAIEIDAGGLPFEDTQDTTAATDEAEEVASSCNDFGEAMSAVWYRLTATEDTRLILDTSGSTVDGGAEMDTVLSVWTGGPGHPLDEAACNDDVGLVLWSRLVLAAAAGETYYIKAGGLGGEAGRVRMNARRAPPAPANDDLAAAVTIDALPFEDTRETISATDEAAEVVSSCNLEEFGANGVWYRFTPADDSVVVVDTEGSTLEPLEGEPAEALDTVLSVWTGGPGHPLDEVECNDDARLGAVWSRITVFAPAGETVYIKASGLFGDTGTIVVHADVAPARPANDDLASAAPIDALPFEDTRDTRAATDEADELKASCSASSFGDRGIWYRFAPAEDASIVLETTGSDFSTSLSAWTGGPDHPLTEIACNDVVGTPRASRLVLEVAAGQVVFVKVGGHFEQRGTAVLRARVAPGAPPNDDLADALAVDALPFDHTVDTLLATDEPGEVAAECALGGSPMHGVWYRFTPETSGRYFVTTAGSSYDTVLSAWLGGAHPLTLLSCHHVDFAADTFNGRLVLRLEAGIEVFLKVDGLDGDGGLARLRVEVPPGDVPNDDLDAALEIGALPFTDRQDTTYATDEPGEASSGCNSTVVNAGSVWYRFTAPADGRVTFDTEGSSFDTVLTVWEGTTHPLTEVACSDDATGVSETWSRVVLDVTAGQALFVQAAGLLDARGDLVFNAAGDLAPPPEPTATPPPVGPTPGPTTAIHLPYLARHQ